MLRQDPPRCTAARRAQRAAQAGAERRRRTSATLAARLTSFVGRDRELRTLAELLAVPAPGDDHRARRRGQDQPRRPGRRRRADRHAGRGLVHPAGRGGRARGARPSGGRRRGCPDRSGHAPRTGVIGACAAATR